ncbi:MAG: SufD family Fe-S cluster assembly protein [Clostridia bacterium]|nr:SufD family Fe-S cluster assembly protein [Clostridia bacterium]
MILNETPVRTSKNYKINNIEIEDLVLPQNLPEFNNVEFETLNSDISNNTSKINLTYGNGKLATDNVINNCNSNLKINVKDDNICITYVFDENNTSLISNLELVLENNTNIAIEYISKTDKQCFHNGIIRLTAKENVKASVTFVNFLNKESTNIYAIENNLLDGSNVDYTIIDLGAKNSISNYYSKLAGNGAKNTIDTIYIGKDNDIKDINYIVDLYGEKTFTNINVQGALKDKSIKNFKGTIDFKKGSKKAKGNEDEFCMLLSDEAISRALPMLLCTEDDIEGNHSSASGKVDDSELFYIMSRGIDYNEAIKLIVKARFNSIIDKIECQRLKDKIVEEIDRRLD